MCELALRLKQRCPEQHKKFRLTHTKAYFRTEHTFSPTNLVLLKSLSASSINNITITEAYTMVYVLNSYVNEKTEF
jgi:hypothetical protein